MTRALLRKQLMEVFSWLYQDKKSDYSDTDLILSYPEWNRNDKM